MINIRFCNFIFYDTLCIERFQYFRPNLPIVHPGNDYHTDGWLKHRYGKVFLPSGKLQIERKSLMIYVSDIYTTAPNTYQTPLQQQTAFYLFITAGSKPFCSKAFSNALGVSRVSFAPAKLMETMLGTKIGAATVFSALLDKQNAVQIIFDKDVVQSEWYGCSDGLTTSYMKLKTAYITDTFLPYAKHIPAVIEV